MKINTTPRFFVRNDINVWLLFLCFLATLQLSSKSGVVVGSPNPNNHFKKSAFNELRSRQRIDKRRTRNDFSSLRSSSGFEDRTSLHGCDVDEFWNATLSSCSPCTRCSKDKGKTGKSWTLRGCGHDRDAVCGTIVDFQNQMSKLNKKQGGNRIKISTKSRRRKNKSQYGRNHRSHKSNLDEEDEQEVYGYVAPRPPPPDYSGSFGIPENQRKGHRRKLSPRHKLKETVKNWSQGRDEFLKQIHEEDNIGVDQNYGNYADEDDNSSNYGQVNYDYDYEPSDYNDDYVDGNQNSLSGKSESSLHQEIARIKNQLEYDDVDEKERNGDKITPPFHKMLDDNSYEVPTTTEKYIFQNTWYPSTRNNGINKYYYNSDNDLTTIKTTEEKFDQNKEHKATTSILVGHTLNVPDFIDVGDEDNDAVINSEYGYAYKEDDITTEVGVFGAVVQKTPKLGEISKTLLEPVDLIGRMLHKNNSIISNNANPSNNKEDSNSGGLRLEHGLVVVGFIIGFGFVFAVGLVYAKVQRVRRFKLLDNANARRKSLNTNPNEGVTSSFIEEATCESSLISSRNSSIDSSQVQPKQISNFQMQPKSSPSSSVQLTSPIGLHSEAGQSRDSQKLFAKATLIKPKTAAEVAAKSYPNVNHYQQQILSPVSTIASEASQSQGKQNLLSPNNPSIILTTQDGMGDVVRNMGTNSSSSSLFGGSSNQSPVSGTPILLSNSVNQPINSTTSNIIQQQNNGQLQQHSTYVDQRGRSQLIKPATPARELPV